MAKRNTSNIDNEAAQLDAYLASAPAPSKNLGVVRPKSYRVDEGKATPGNEDASLSPLRFKGTPGDLAITARYSGKMTAMRLDDWQGDPETGIDYTYIGGPRAVVVRFGNAGQSQGLTESQKAARKERIEAFDPTVKG